MALFCNKITLIKNYFKNVLKEKINKEINKNEIFFPFSNKNSLQTIFHTYYNLTKCEQGSSLDLDIEKALFTNLIQNMEAKYNFGSDIIFNTLKSIYTIIN